LGTVAIRRSREDVHERVTWQMLAETNTTDPFSYTVDARGTPEGAIAEMV